ncbi:hypothetical protein [Verrucomicrobium spinosum]|uniref:hypothetical protein n=1 Tax=Verrucomicrobium spinosum TaxID=2736 RepID=UPI0012E30D41|nr:hypothetical protein [Verrucomicrobium spinosum]
MKSIPFNLACLLSLALAAPAFADISTTMKEAMKGETSLYKKVATGKGSDEDAQKLLKYVKSLPAESPEKGDAASWKEKTDKLVKATEDVAAKKPGALQELQTAGNCKACHSVHKG